MPAEPTPAPRPRRRLARLLRHRRRHAKGTPEPEPPEDPRRALAWRPYPFELVAWAGMAAAVIFLRSRGLRIDWLTVRYTIPPLVPVTLQALAVGVVLHAAYALLSGGSLRAYLRRVCSLPWLVLAARLWLVCLIFTYSYFWLKVSVPLVNGRLWDRSLWSLDVAIHAGFSPSIFVTEVLAGTGLLEALDLWYSWWLLSVTYGVGFFLASPLARVRRSFMLSCVLIWTLGPWIYLSLPAVGPAYVYPEIWTEVGGEMPRAAGAQAALWDNYRKVLAGRQGGLRQFNPTRGVAAMPSLHVGAHWLLMLWSRRSARALFLPAVLGTLLTLVGSIATGWHYAVDAYVGIAVAQLAFWIATRPPPARRAAAAGEATTIRACSSA